MVRMLLILIAAIGLSFLVAACGQPAASQIDSSQYLGRLDKVTLDIPTMV